MDRRTCAIETAAALYFAIVFAVGFVLGTIRVLWLEPRVGPIVARPARRRSSWLPWSRRPLGAEAVRLPRDRLSLVLMGVGALLLQQIADFAVGIGLRGIGPSEPLAQFTTAQGLIYAALLVAFVVMPLLLNRASMRAPGKRLA